MKGVFAISLAKVVWPFAVGERERARPERAIWRSFGEKIHGLRGRHHPNSAGRCDHFDAFKARMIAVTMPASAPGRTTRWRRSDRSRSGAQPRPELLFLRRRYQRRDELWVLIRSRSSPMPSSASPREELSRRQSRRRATSQTLLVPA